MWIILVGRYLKYYHSFVVFNGFYINIIGYYYMTVWHKYESYKDIFYYRYSEYLKLKQLFIMHHN